MGVCRSTECSGVKRKSSYASSKVRDYSVDEGSTETFARVDGAIESRAVHQGAILGIASAGAGELVTCGEDKTVRLHKLVGDTGSRFQNYWASEGHSGTVARVVYGLKTSVLYSCSRDSTVRQWSRQQNTALAVFKGHILPCTAVALSADEGRVCSGSRDTSLRVWDTHTGVCVALTSVPRNLVTCLKYLPADSSTLVQGGEDLKLRVWDVRGGLVQVQTIECIYFPLCLDVSSDGRQVLTSSKGFDGAGCETKLWDLRSTALPVQKYTGHTQDITACVLFHGGVRAEDDVDCAPQMLATASKDGTVKIYDQTNGNILVDHAETDCGGYTGLAFQRDPVTRRPMIFASTITGGLYALRLEEEEEEEQEEESRRGVGGELRLRCSAFVQGSSID